MELRNVISDEIVRTNVISKILTRKVSTIGSIVFFLISFSVLIASIQGSNKIWIIISAIATGLYTIALLILLYDFITMRKKK